MINRVIKASGPDCKCNKEAKMVDTSFNVSEVTLQSLDIKKWTVIFFFPKLYTGLCTDEIMDFNNNFDSFKKLGFDVYGVSTDDSKTHLKYMKEHKLKFNLIADENSFMSRWFHIFDEDQKIALRGTYIINPDKKIVAELNTAKFVGRNIKEILRIAESTQLADSSNKPVFCNIKK